jgi:hypothetical protein
MDGNHLPAAFSQVVSDVVAFADPLISGLPGHALWLSAEKQWQ